MSTPTEAHFALASQAMIHRDVDHVAQLIADSEARAVESAKAEWLTFANEREAVLADATDERDGWKIRYDEASRIIDKLRIENEGASAAVAEIENIGQLTGCNHTEGLSRCVREKIEAVEAERDELRAEVEDLKARITQDHGIVELMEAELKDLKSAGGPPFIRSEAIRNLRDQVCGLKTRAEKAEDEKAILTDRLSEAITGQNNEALRHGRRIEELEAELATERARLDFLESSGWRVQDEDDDHVSNLQVTICQKIGVPESPRSVRAAIDAAMKEGA